MTTSVRALDHGIQMTNVWLRDMEHALGSEDRQYAYRALRAVLHVLRDRLTVDEAAQLAAQLPDLLRGVYYEGWDPSGTPARYRHQDEFLDRVAAAGGYHGRTEAGYAVTAALSVVRRHVSRGELDDVAAVLPAELAELVTSA